MTVPHPQRVSPNSQRKGRRLHQEGKIHRITGSEVWLVEGDTGTYLVPVAGPYMTCPCRHHGACSHPQGIREAIKAGDAHEITVDELVAMRNDQVSMA